VAESATGDSSLLAGPVRTAVREADPDIPVRIRHLGAVRAESMAERRFILFVLGGFSLLGLLLAAAGIYGVVSYSVARRTREMGVRLALGADPGSVRNRVLRDALRPVVVGLVLGVTGAGLLVGALRGLPELLYRVEPNDPATWVGVTLLLLAVGVGASWLPARRGTRVDPMVTMRAE
jgi:putative ABC transport system permease protein